MLNIFSNFGHIFVFVKVYINAWVNRTKCEDYEPEVIYSLRFLQPNIVFQAKITSISAEISLENFN